MSEIRMTERKTCPVHGEILSKESGFMVCPNPNCNFKMIAFRFFETRQETIPRLVMESERRRS